MVGWDESDAAILAALWDGPQVANHDDDASWDALGQLSGVLLRASTRFAPGQPPVAHAPGAVFNYWDEPAPPADVVDCLASWKASGLPVRTFDREAADDYLRDHYGGEVLEAFRYAHHPSMQSDILRMAYLHAHGGLYVDADDRFVGTTAIPPFRAGSALVSLAACRHCPASLLPRVDDPAAGHAWYYPGSAPWFATPGHPFVERSLDRAVGTMTLRRRQGELAQIHRDVGPGCVAMAMLDYARDCLRAGRAIDLSVSPGWDFVAQSQPLGYKSTARNWRSNSVLYPQPEAAAAVAI